MKLFKKAGKKVVKISKKEWLALGKKAGWTKKAWATANWSGMDPKEIISTQNIQEMCNFCYWLGQGQAEDRSSSFQDSLKQKEQQIPGFLSMYNSNPVYRSDAIKGFNDTVKLFSKGRVPSSIPAGPGKEEAVSYERVGDEN